jgi:hypothetical protein
MGHKSRSKSKEEAVGGGINDITTANYNPNNNMRRFLQPAHDVAIVVPATTTTILEPNRRRQLQDKTNDGAVPTPQDPIALWAREPPFHHQC